MARGVNGLGPETDRRTAGLRGNALSDERDPALQAIVEELARRLRTPIALVTLVLRRVQLFRADHGLPADLAWTRATDRDASFCQFVVRDGELLSVTNAEQNAMLPQALVEDYGIRAYLGAPVVVDGNVVGALCAIDVKVRAFDEEEAEVVRALANRASARLTELSRDRRETRLLASGHAPVYADLHTSLDELERATDEVRVASAELRAWSRAGRSGTKTDSGALPEATHAYDDLTVATRDVAEVTERIREGFAQLEGLMRVESDTLANVVRRGIEASRTVLERTGGVELADLDERPLAFPAPLATAALATIAGFLAQLRPEGGATPLRVHCEHGPEGREVCFDAGLDEGRTAAAETCLRPLVEASPRIRLRRTSTTIRWSVSDEPSMAG